MQPRTHTHTHHPGCLPCLPGDAHDPGHPPLITLSAVTGSFATPRPTTYKYCPRSRPRPYPHPLAPSPARPTADSPVPTLPPSPPLPPPPTETTQCSPPTHPTPRPAYNPARPPSTHTHHRHFLSPLPYYGPQVCLSLGILTYWRVHRVEPTATLSTGSFTSPSPSPAPAPTRFFYCPPHHRISCPKLTTLASLPSIPPPPPQHGNHPGGHAHPVPPPSRPILFFELVD